MTFRGVETCLTQDTFPLSQKTTLHNLDSRLISIKMLKMWFFQQKNLYNILVKKTLVSLQAEVDTLCLMWSYTEREFLCGDALWTYF